MRVDNQHFVDGFVAFHAGLPEEANPFLYLANPFRLWRYGWRTAAFSDMAERGIHCLEGDDARGCDEATLLRLDKSPFDQGKVAYMRGIALSDYPYGPGTPDAIEWQQGWHETRLKAGPIYPEFDPAKHVEKLSPFAWLISHPWIAGLLLAGAAFAVALTLTAR